MGIYPPDRMIRTTRTGRADLVRLLRSGGAGCLDENAPLFGYTREKKRANPRVKPTGQTIAGSAGPPQQDTHVFLEPRGEMKFWCPVKFENKDPDDIRIQAPEWAQKGDTLSLKDARAKEAFRAPVYFPLEKTSRIWPFIKSVLGTLAATADPDMEKVVPLAARLSPMNRLPMETRLTWHARGCVVIDFHDRLMPFWQDIRQIADLITGVRGNSGLELRILEKGPQQGFRKFGNRDFRFYPFRPPSAGTPVLILSDLGGFSASRDRMSAWIRFGRACRAKGITPVVLTPCPSYSWDNRLCSFFTMVWWDRGQKLPRPDSLNRVTSVRQAAAVKDPEEKVENLLSLLSCAVRVEPGLLRAVRFALPPGAADSGTEAMAWNHSHMRQSPVACSFDNKAVAAYRDRFVLIAADPQKSSLVTKIIILRNVWHKMLAEAVRCEEEMVAADMCKRDPAPWAGEFLETFFRTVSGAYATEDMTAWFNRLSNRLMETTWSANSRVLTPTFLTVNRKAWEQGTVVLPKGADLAHAAWLTTQNGSVQTIIVYQVGSQLAFLQQQGQTVRPDHNGFSLGSPVISFETSGDYSINGIKASPGKNFWMDLPEEGEIQVDTDIMVAVIGSIAKPVQADAIGRDQIGLFIRFPKSDQNIYHPWGDLGEDKFGIYTDYQVKGVEFRMRWIRPGNFMMGSPDDEPERRNNESRHEVTVTKGFWLADTTCTQELWQAVTGNNPSRFKGKDHPVDTVSWEDCRVFLDRINKACPGLNLDFPTEAQWEYACRDPKEIETGQYKPFSFGKIITPDQVNYDGNYPYGDATKGEFREKTVPVKNFAPNGRGLYQMHGNLWEWCRDWYGDYSSGSIVDPTGPDDGEFRVLRGGAWIGYAWHARSAYRHGNEPGLRLDFFGFRFSRGQIGPGRRPGQGRQEKKKRKNKQNSESKNF